MLRGLVALYLIVATLVGPRLCLCPASVTAAAPNAPSIPENTVPRSCGCCKTSTATPSTATPSPGQQCPDQPSVPCQCQCGKQDTAATVRAVGRTAKSSVDHDGFPGPVPSCGVHYPAPIQHVFSVDHVRDLPFYTTHDILYVFHRLRC
ncbi:MAG: hypothetical protein C0467_31675 [Planctomycetaceae bacterium]|nr:hypothetical protein [Planctomycetaceae bacterium]